MADTNTSWAVQVSTFSDPPDRWTGNACRYRTREDAEVSARDLASRWFAVREWRVVQSADAPNKDAPTVLGAGHRVRL